MHDAGSTTSSCDTSSHTSHTSHTSHSSDGTWAATQHLSLNPTDPAYSYDNANIRYENASIRPSAGGSRMAVTALVAIILSVVILLIGLSLI